MATATATPPQAVIPFHGAAREAQEPWADVTVTPSANVQSVLQGAAQSIPADGYLRAIWIEVSGSGGTGNTLASSGLDYPFNVIESVMLHDVNGNPLIGPLSGYQLFLANYLGGYMFNGDVRQWYGFSADKDNPAFAIRVPIEVNRQSGFGALANQSASANYRVKINLSPSSDVWSVVGTAPDLRFRVAMEVWKQPNATDVMGRPQQTQPPAHGTTQYWSVQTQNINAGFQSFDLTRMGNVIRNWIFVLRDSSGDRVTDANLPDPLAIDWDARAFINESLSMYKNRQIEGYTDREVAPERGVVSYSWDRTGLGHVGGGSAAMYLPTVQATRMTVKGTFPAAGTLEIITNDIAPYESNPAYKFSEGSATGFNPQVGTAIPGGGA